LISGVFAPAKADRDYNSDLQNTTGLHKARLLLIYPREGLTRPVLQRCGPNDAVGKHSIFQRIIVGIFLSSLDLLCDCLNYEIAEREDCCLLVKH